MTPEDSQKVDQLIRTSGLTENQARAVVWTANAADLCADALDRLRDQIGEITPHGDSTVDPWAKNALVHIEEAARDLWADIDQAERNAAAEVKPKTDDMAGLAAAYYGTEAADRQRHNDRFDPSKLTPPRTRGRRL